MKKMLCVGLLGLAGIGNASSVDYVPTNALPSTDKMVSGSGMLSDLASRAGGYLSSAKGGLNRIWEQPRDVHVANAAGLGVSAGMVGLVGYGLYSLYKNYTSSDKEALTYSKEIAQAFHALSLDPMSNWNTIIAQYNNYFVGPYDDYLQDNDKERDERLEREYQDATDAYNYLKGLHKKNQLPYELNAYRNYLSKESAEALDKFEQARQKAKRNSFAPPVDAPVSPEAEKHAMEVLHKLLPELNQLKAMAAK